MANTYTQIYVQIVFAVQGRRNLITEYNREKLEKYICGIISNKKSKPLAIYCNPDHTHVLIGLDPSVSVSDIGRDIIANSSKWINENRWIIGKFNWQEGFGAFTYSKSQIDRVSKYILNQAKHHRKISFREEYFDFLDEYGIEYNEKYVFKWIE
jgi:REP element-mobilizing transposase RayT